MTYTLEQQAANRTKWVAALRSGEFPQGRRYLRTTDDQYCCLGVACELAAREGVIPPFADGKYDGDGCVLTPAVQDWLGLHDDCGVTYDEYPIGDPDEDGDYAMAGSLTELNDSGEWTFNRLADLIESGKLMKVRNV